MSLFDWIGSLGRPASEKAVWAMMSGGNHAEKTVTVDTVQNLSTAWSCGRLIEGTASTLPLNIMRRVNGKVEVATDHPVQQVLKFSPNASQTPVEFKRGMIQSLIFRGMAYALKEMSGDDLVALTPIDYERCQPIRLANGQLRYRVTDRLGRQREVTPDEMFVIKGPTDNRDIDVGMSVVTYGRQTFGNAIAVEETVGRQYAKGLRQRGFFYTENPAARLDADKREQFKAIIDQFTGSQNAGATMLLEGGFKWQAMEMNPADWEMLATRGFNVEEICRWFQVPPIMIGHSEKTTSWPAGSEALRRFFRDFTMLPHLTTIEQAIDARLLTMEDRLNGYYAKFSTEGLMRGDAQARGELYSSALQNGWMTRDEVRELEDWPSIGETDGGALHTVQANLVPLDGLRDYTERTANAGTPPNPPEPTPGV